jgi:AcrR family transcriptional regulator
LFLASQKRQSKLVPIAGGRKVQILDAALTLIADRGYHGTSMQEIARLVGVSASSLYNHIKSKQDLLVDIMMTTMMALLTEFDSANSSRVPSAQLRNAMEAHVCFHALHQREVRIGNREIPSLELPARNKVVDLRSEYARKWQLLIQSGMDEGYFKTPSPQLATYAILEMGIGVSLWYRTDGPLSLNQIAHDYGRMALRLVGADD